jgi:hypothetical protein
LADSNKTRTSEKPTNKPVCAPIIPSSGVQITLGTASALCRADAGPPHARGRHELPPLGLGAVSALVAR